MAALALMGPAQADADVVCEYHSSSRAALLTGTGSGPVTAQVRGGAIELSAMVPYVGITTSLVEIPCTDADRDPPSGAPVALTVENTDTIRFEFDGLLSLSSRDGGWFAPGASAEAGAPEIELFVGDEIESLSASLPSALEVVELGQADNQAGINFNAASEPENADPDLVFEGQPPSRPGHYAPVSVQTLGTRPMRLSAVGGAGFDGGFPVRVSLSGGSGDDVLEAGPAGANLNDEGGYNVFTGGPGDDEVRSCGGGGGRVTGAGGDDYLAIGRGVTSLDGGPGNDDASFQCWSGPHGVTVDLREHDFQKIGGSSRARMRNAENLYGPDGSGSLLTGDAGPNVLGGFAGDDVLRGLGGDDRLRGYKGVDTLLGGAGDDLLRAGDGQDLLIGGPGMDSLLGQIGADRLDARDGQRDRRISCGPGDLQLEVAQFDEVDPDPRSC